MGNAHVRPHPRTRNKKQVRWKAAGPLMKCFGDSRLPSFDLARPFPPGKPQLISENEATPDLVTIRWTKPTSDGGSPISGYLVEHRRTGSPHWVRASPLLVQIPEVTISGLEPGWRYQFRVRAENAVGLSDPSELSEPITVTLQRSAITAPRFTQELQDTVALENEKSEFVVHFLGQPAPKVCWYKDGFEIFSSRRIRILTESGRSVLTIHQSSLSDEGEIKCTATNRAGHISTKAALTVQAPPSIRLPRQYEDGLLFEIGETIRLKVSVAGRPTPLVFWNHNGESIKNNDRYEIEHIDKSSVLKINEALREDRGEYQVKAVNKLGENTQSFLVTVTNKPSPPGKARVIMALGRSVTLSWGTPQDDGGCKIGNYIIEYYRLGWNVWLKAATSRQLTTMLGDLIEGSEYKFRVKAESPYGVSDPSEESEVVFIPDPKRGILQPQARGRSQPRDVVPSTNGPVANRRKKPRSQSSSRVEEYNPLNVQSRTQSPNPPNSVPVRPERTKIKSPPKTPEMSPMANRKETSLQINKEILEQSERSSVARDLAYGSPEIKVKREHDLSPSHMNNYSSNSEKSKSPSPIPDKDVNHKVHAVKIEPPQAASTAKHSRSPSPDVHKTKLPRENNENFTGSSEFMLVLYSDENERGHSDFDFDENSVPPPLSLSAPELGSEPPLMNNLKTSASSTELLHERAMMRFYQAAEAEEAELEKRRKASKNKEQIKDIPKIQINSKDEQDIVGLERQSSFRRRMSAVGVSHQQALWAQRRHSLRSPSEVQNDTIQNKLHKSPMNSDLKREAMMIRQRSESEEREDEAFEQVRQRMILERQSSAEKRKKIAVADIEKWADDYESSTEEDDSEISEDERPPTENQSRKIYYEDGEEEDTYHPGAIRTEPFEILTKRKLPPDPNFIPKPILKKKEHEERIEEIPSRQPSTQNNSKTRSSSPRPQNLMQRERSQSIAGEVLDIQSIKNKFQPKTKEEPRPRSFSLIPQKELLTKEVKIPEGLILPEIPGPVAPGHTISAVAQISGITAASIVIPDKLLEKKKDAEEAKVVIDHYGDIVKNFGQRKKSNPRIYLDRDSLKKVAENIDTPQTTSEDNKINDPYAHKVIPIEPKENPVLETPFRRSSFTDHYDSKPIIQNLKSEIDYTEKPNGSSNYHDNYIRRSSFTDHYDSTPRRDSLKGSPNRSSREGNVSPQRNRERTLSKSPPKQAIHREPSPRRSPARSKPLMSPVRQENWSNSRRSNAEKPKRKTSPSPMRKGTGRKTSPSPLRKPRKTSPSPLRREIANSKTRSTSPSPALLRKPMLREIMTQTSVGLESFDTGSHSGNSSPVGKSQKQEELMAQAEVKVRTMVDYITDLAMFVVACWLYLFKNELLAIPVLLIMAYRQLQAEVAKRIPKWILRRWKGKKK